MATPNRPAEHARGPGADNARVLLRLGRLVHRRRRAVLLVWLLLTVAGFAISGSVFERLSPTNGAADSESIQGLRLLDRASPYTAEIDVVVDGVGPQDPALGDAVAAVDAVPGVGRVRSPADPEGAALVAQDGQAVALVVDLDRAVEDTDAVIADVRGVLDPWERTDGVRVLLGGDLLLQEEITLQVERDLQRAELIAIPVSLVVLVVVFGGLIAAGLPVIGAVAAVGVAFPALLAFTTILDLDPNVVPVTTFLGLGLAIDYSLLMVSRYREERGAGLDTESAVARTTATAGRTILFSGLTVATSLAGLFVFSEPIFRAIAAAGVSVVLIAVAVALTLVPALLAALGDRLKVPSAPLPQEGRFSRLAGWVQRRPWPVALLTAAVLVLLGTPIVNVEFGLGGANQLPAQFESRQLEETLQDRFPAAAIAPVTVVSTAPAATFTRWWEATLAELPPARVQAVQAPQELTRGVVVGSLVPRSDSGSALVGALRAADPPPGTFVTGNAAIIDDFTDSILARAPYALALVVLASLVLLFLMTGSVVVPVKALAMNVVSLGATFGAVTWVFAEGHLEGVLGFEANGSLETWLPVLIFAFAFGLSMDYEVFLLARVKEAYDVAVAGDPTATRGGRRSDVAVRRGLQGSGRIITSAALLIVIVFACLATAQVLSIKILGVALAIAVAVDATVVRCLLVPATMTLLGEANWWAPPVLRRWHARFGLRETIPDEPEPAGAAS